MEVEFIQERMNPTNRILAIDLFGRAMPKTVNNFMKLCDANTQ
jgi:cyclophilin family peptidyl-prolyl cis-trans isomerase